MKPTKGSKKTTTADVPQKPSVEYIEFEEIKKSSPRSTRGSATGRSKKKQGTNPLQTAPASKSEILDDEILEDDHTEVEDTLDAEIVDTIDDLETDPKLGDENALIAAPKNRVLKHDTATNILPAGATLEEEEKALATLPISDPLKQYLKEVQRHPLLTPEEEINLALQLQREGNLEAAKKLVSANLRLVVKIAFEYRSLYVNVLDLIQEGNIGLMKAVSKYDPAKGARLGYYASWWIRSYILKYLLDNFRLIKVGTTQAQKKLFYHLMREKGRLEAQGLVVGPKLLAEKLNVREKDVIEMEHRLSGLGVESSLDATRSFGDGETDGPALSESLKDPGEGADTRLEREQLLQILSRRLPEFEKTLNSRERQLLQERILTDSPKTLQEVADDYGLTRERARQIEARLILKLRKFLEGDLAELEE